MRICKGQPIKGCFAIIVRQARVGISGQLRTGRPGQVYFLQFPHLEKGASLLFVRVEERRQDLQHLARPQVVTLQLSLFASIVLSTLHWFAHLILQL